MNKNHRPLTDWERERWAAIVSECCRSGGSIKLSVGAKAIILAVDSELRELEDAHGRLRDEP